MINATEKAWDLEPLLMKCHDDFQEQCSLILGEEKYNLLTKMLTGAADKLDQSMIRPPVQDQDADNNYPGSNYPGNDSV